MDLTEPVHDTSGVRRRSRRKMDRLAKEIKKHPDYPAAQAQVKAEQARIQGQR